MPKENTRYTCIACITIDSLIKIEKKNYPQVYLEECKYKIRKIQMSRFINTELDSDSDWFRCWINDKTHWLRLIGRGHYEKYKN